MLWLGITRMLCTTFSLEIWLWNGFVHSGSKHVNISLTLIGPCVLAGWEQGRCSLCSDLWKITLWLLFMSPVYYLCTDTCFTFPTLNCGENIFITLVLVAGRIIKFAKIFNKHFNGGGSWHGFRSSKNLIFFQYTTDSLCPVYSVFTYGCYWRGVCGAWSRWAWGIPAGFADSTGSPDYRSGSGLKRSAGYLSGLTGWDVSQAPGFRF